MTSKKVNYLQSGKHIPEYVETIAFTDYKLQKGDYLYIRVYTLYEKSQRLFNGGSNNANIQQSSDNANARLHLYLIGEDGCINYPYVGKIQMLGLESRSKERYGDKLSNMLHNFSVDVKLMNRTFSVIEAGSGRYQI